MAHDRASGDEPVRASGSNVVIDDQPCMRTTQLFRLAVTLMGDPDRSDELGLVVEEIVQVLESVPPPGDREFGINVSLLGDTMLDGIAVARSEPLLLRAIPVLDPVADRENLWRVHRTLGHVRRRSGRNAEAAEAFGEAIARCGSEAGIDVVLDLRREHANALCDAGEASASAELLSALVRPYSEAYGGLSLDLADLNDALAIAFLKADRPSEAMMAARRALEILEEAEGENGLSVARVLGVLMPGIYRALGRDDMREIVQRLAIAIYRRAAPDDFGQGHSSNFAMALSNLASTLAARGSHDDATTLLREAISIKERRFAEGWPLVATLNKLGAVLGSQGRFEEAERSVSRSLAIAEQELGPDHPDTRHARELYGQIRSDLASAGPGRRTGEARR